MPTYEYVCMSCGRHVEVVQSFSDEPLRTCEHCGGPLKRVFHPVGIVLKGSGFYSTDNRSSRSKAAAAESKKESSPESTGSEKKTSESKGSESKGSGSKDSGSKGSESKSKPESSSSKSSPNKSDGGSKS
jgi:putative FmdB family regulatory protein